MAFPEQIADHLSLVLAEIQEQLSGLGFLPMLHIRLQKEKNSLKPKHWLQHDFFVNETEIVLSRGILSIF